MADLLKAAKDPKFREDVIRGLGETFSRGVAGIVGAPVDIATMAMRPFGYNVPAEQVVGGSEYIGKQMEEAGLISSARNPVAEFLAGVAIPDPMDAAKLGAMFIGPIAKAWDADAAARAAKMEAEGFDPRTIWSETGTWRGPDNKWRQEISDAEAKLQDIPGLITARRQDIKKQIDEIVKSVKPGEKPTPEQIEKVKELNAQRFVGDYKGNVGSVLEHPELFRSNPETKDISFDYFEMPSGARGYYSPEEGVSVSSKIAPNEAKSTLLHELQHSIQQREGFARGGSSEEFAGESMQQAVNSQRLLDNIAKTGAEDFGRFYEKGNFADLQSAAEEYAKKKDIPVDDAYTAAESFWTFGGERGGLSGLQNRIKQAQAAIDEAFTSPFEKYRRLAGEAEARATEARLNLTAAERRAKFPEESYDVPLSELIIRDQPIGRSMSTRQAPRDEAMRIAQANAAKPVSEGGLGLPPDNTAMDRAKAMGFDVQFLHGASKTPSKKIYEDGMYLGETEPELKDFQAVIPGKGSGEGGAFFGTDSPAIARGYATQTKERTGATYPLMTRSEDLMESGFNKPIPEGNISEWLNDLERYNRSLDKGKSRYFREQIEKSKKEGKGGVVFRNTEDAAVDIGMTEPSDIYAITTAPVRSRFAAFDPARRYESDLLGAADPRLLAGVAGATGAGLYGASRMQEGEERPQPRFGFRPDGTPKGEGWLGVLPLSDGNVATEYSMQSQAVKVGDQMVDFPTLVPTLNQEEVNLMLSDIIPNRKPIPEPIVQKAIKHAKQRLDKGLSPFKELGE